MNLYEQWLSRAFYQDGRTNEAVWTKYLEAEQKIYEQILEQKIARITGTIEGLSARFLMPLDETVAFVDGINGILDEEYDVNELTAESTVDIPIDLERLYKKMVEYKAEHLYNLPQWKNVFSADKLLDLYKEQKRSTTFVKTEAKIGRNDPCPCGSGKKYKKCCGVGK